MNVIGNIIADSLSLGMGYGERLLKDVTDQQFSRFAVGENGKPVVSNHAGFVYGHLSLYAPRIVKELGGTAIMAPKEFESVFSKDATCQDDSQGDIYPAKKVVVDFFTESYVAALELLRQTSDDTFKSANPAEGRLKELFPTIGSMHAFYVGGHFMMHMGQVSAWRRMIGLTAA